MLRIEKIKKEIKNFDTDVTADEILSCWLHRITTNSSVNKYNCSGLVCSECLRRSLLELLEEYKETVKLSKFEYEYLKVAKENGYNFITRDKDNRLYGTSEKPEKYNTTWASSGAYIGMFKSMFKFVQWKNEEPYSINSILSNCEVIEDEKS
ncbi:hypothetical protein [Thomasclavelia ramosa]|uniref:hypothetical protein n=1 Tax=Thomasclavelia ramosa TaxID=1547 RepID=UPI000E5105AB|nr:hypothetical protein [Thomasclavelia ramosa]RGT23057.1 hypothetical protein DWX42_11890 [Thomasclavelia ramosa]